MAIRTKTDLRKEFLIRREGIAADTRARHSSLIRQRVFQLPFWRSAETILCYISFGSEVDTHLLIQEAIRFKKRVVVPLGKTADQPTSLSELRRWGELVPGPIKSILQPAPEFQKAVPPSEVELVLVPGLAFDRWGGRLGMGGGYFDRLFPQMTRALRVGLAYSSQISPDPLPREPHDQKMHRLVTESEALESLPEGQP